MSPAAAIALNNSMGRGISNSAIIGAAAWENRPNRLQIPNAVPQSNTGNNQGVAM